MKLNLWGDIIKTLFQSVATITFFSVITRFLSFLFKIYISNQISTIELGIYSVAMSVAGVFLTILTSGLPLVISRFSANSTRNKPHSTTHQAVSAGIIISIILSLFVLIFIIFGKPFFNFIFTDNTSYIVILTLLPMLIFSAFYAPIKGYLWGKEDYFSVSIVEIFEQIIRFIICFILFAIIPNKNIPAGLSLGIATIFSTLLGYYLYIKKGGKIASPKKQFKNVFKSIIPLTSIRVAGSILPPLISIILPFLLVKAGYSESQALSDIGVLMGMTFPILTIPTTLVGSLSMALIPKLTILNQENSNSSLKKQILNSITFTLFCSFICVPILTSLGIPICEFLFHNFSAGKYLQSFAWIVVPMGLAQISTSILNSLNKEKFVFVSYFISASAMLVMILILPQFVGVSALLLGIATQNLLVSIINIIKMKKIVNSSTNTLSVTFKFVIICCLVCLLSFWLFNIFNLLFVNIISICLTSFVSIVSFVILSYAFNIINLDILLHFKKLKHN